MEPPFQRILVAYDGSPYAKRALKLACRLSRSFGASIRVIHVIDVARSSTIISGIGLALEKSLIEKGRSIAREAEEIAGSHGVKAEAVLKKGHPAEEIIREAREWKADLIVMGCRGLGGFEKLLLGSVSDSVVRLAPCPVLIVR